MFLILQSALFNFHSFLTVVLLGICTCTYIKMQFPAILEHRTGYVLCQFNLLCPIHLVFHMRCYIGFSCIPLLHSIDECWRYVFISVNLHMSLFENLLQPSLRMASHFLPWVPLWHFLCQAFYHLGAICSPVFVW